MSEDNNTATAKAEDLAAPSQPATKTNHSEAVQLLNKLLKFCFKQKGSDLHISSGMPPNIRIDGDMIKVDSPPLPSEFVEAIINATAPAGQQESFKTIHEADYSYEIPGVARFRVNAYRQNRGPSMVLRTIPSEVLSMDALGMGGIFRTLSDKPKGLVLVTGPTGSGKSTTLAAMIDYINDTHKKHILTIEDPIEFVHQSKKSLVNQREMHRDTVSFSNSLRAALREDPDVILVGEMRDHETISLALTAAETGHLVFGTLHTSSAAKTVDRVVDVFPAEEQNMIRAMLSESLQGVISQTLLKKKGGGRVAAHEIMVCTHAIRNMIRENKIALMYSAIQTGSGDGMQTMDMALDKLLKDGLVSIEDARKKSLDPNKLHAR